MNSKIDIFKSTRLIVASTLYDTLSEFLEKDDQISEAEFRDNWLFKLREHDSILPDGWYSPPPHGVAVLFGEDSDGEDGRVNFESLRGEDKWPSENAFLDRVNGIASFYASPVDKESGLIGDFGLTIYFGKDKKIQAFLKKSLEVTFKVVETIEVGQKFLDIYKNASSILKDNGFVNLIESSTDSTGTNIGHTIPGSYYAWSDKQKEILASGSMEEIIKLLSTQRKFVNIEESLKVSQGMLFTIEPRPKSLKNPDLPSHFFHTVCAVHENEEIEIITGFGKLFELVGMDYV